MESHRRLVNLDPETIATLNHALQEGRSMEEVKATRPSMKHELPDLQLDREFRSRNLALIHSLLQNPLQQLISTELPSPNATVREYLAAKGISESQSFLYGLLYMYDGHMPNYREDGLQWEATKKMCVKLVVYNEENKTYKLKNSKTDQGVVVMRRQTWKGVQGYWRKHEYKLIRREQFYRPESDGSLSVNEIQKLQDFPVLVHYFCKHPESEGNPEEPPLAPPPMKSRKRRKVSHNDSDTEDEPGSGMTVGPPSGSSNPGPLLLSNTELKPRMFNFSGNSFWRGSGVGAPHLTSSMGMGSPGSMLERITSSNSGVPVEIASFLSGGALDFDFQPQTPSLTRSSDALVAPPLTTSAIVTTYAPDVGPFEAATKVIVQVKGFPSSDNPEQYQYSCMFEQTEVPLHQIADGVFEFFTPPQPTAGIVFFWCVCKANRDNGEREALYSTASPFFFTPLDEAGHLTLQFESVHVYTPEDRAIVISKFKYSVRELDLSNNNLSTVPFLSEMTQLHTLILDHNFLTSDTVLPTLPKLKTLSINHNRISNLEVFIERIKAAFPSLQYLSMLDNEACPYFSARPHHYYNFRIYVISCLPNLTHLNSSAVTMDELRHATSIMERKGKPTLTFSSSGTYPTTPTPSLTTSTSSTSGAS